MNSLAKKRGNPLTADDWNTLVAAVDPRLIGDDSVLPTRFLATTLKAGDHGVTAANDYTDARYWVWPVFENRATSPGDLIEFGDGAASLFFKLPATNLAEWNLQYSEGHIVPPATIVEVQQIQGTTGVYSWVFNLPWPLTITIKTAPGTTFPRTYTAKPIYAGVEYGRELPTMNLAELEYTNPGIANSYREFQVNDVVDAWFDYVHQQYNFRSFRIYTTTPCP